MNQIPNIEETHNTKKVEEKIIEEFQDKDHIITNDGKLYVEIDAHWLHHQLQKARHDWLREEIVKLEAEQRNHHCSRYDGNDYDNGAYVALQTIIDRYSQELNEKEI